MKEGNKRLTKFYCRHAIWLLVNIVLLVASGAFRTFGAAYIDPIMDAMEKKQLNDMFSAILVGGILMSSSYILRWGAAEICTWLKEKLGIELRMSIMRHLQKLPYPEYEKLEAGDVQSLLRNDVNQAANIVYIEHSRILMNIFLFVIAVGYMMTINLWATLVIVAVTAVLTVLNQNILNKLKVYEKGRREAVGQITNTVSSAYTGMDTVKTYRAQDYIRSFFLKGKHNYNVSSMRAEKADTWRLVLYNSISQSVFFVTLLYLSFQGISGKLDLGDILVFLTLLRQIMTPIETVFRWMGTRVRCKAAWERIEGYLSETGQDEVKCQTLNISDEVNISNVSYAYDASTPILKDVSLALKKGKITVLKGESGSGKTTLLKILLGLYPCVDAKFLVDSEPKALSSFNSAISFVSSECMLFNMSIYDNIALGNPQITREACMDAFKRLGLQDWIQSLPQGIDTLVDENAMNLSGGQRQIIAVIRCLLSNRSVLVLDEPFAALDAEREETLLNWLNKEAQTRFVLVVSHRQGVNSWNDSNTLFVQI